MKSGVSPARSVGPTRARSLSVPEPEPRRRSPAGRRWRRCSRSRAAAASARRSARRTRAPPARTPRADRRSAARAGSRAARCRCTPGRRRWRPCGARANAISVAPSPSRRSTLIPRASSSWANISARRYDSPNGFDATITGRGGVLGARAGRPRRSTMPASAMALASAEPSRAGTPHARHPRPREQRPHVGGRRRGAQLLGRGHLLDPARRASPRSGRRAGRPRTGRASPAAW